MGLPTLLDIAKINGASEGLVALFDEAARSAPEVTGMAYFMGQLKQVPNIGASRTIKGTQFRTLVRTGLPTFQFRNANAGTKATKSTYENRLVECFIADMQWQADKVVADACEDGAAAYIAEEASAIITSALMGLGTQFYYGRKTVQASLGDALGHPGLIDAVDTSLVVDATGTTANTGSSLWGVKWGPAHVQWVFGGGASFNLVDPRIQLVNDPNDSTKQFFAYVQGLPLWAGVQVKNRFSVSRIKNLTADVGKGLTDALIGKLISQYPAAYKPDCFFASPRSIEQLRASRTATTTTGKEADVPVDWQGIPIIPTDSIVNTEAIA
jgi:hypothetical protein